MSIPLIDRPVIIIGCSRSGTTLLFNNLAEHPQTWSLYEESFPIFYRHFPVHPDDGDRLTAAPSPEVARAIHETFYAWAHNKEVLKDRRLLRWIPSKLLQRPVGRLYKRRPLRLVEKTPANSLRVPLLCALFPDARFIFLVRRAEDVISSLMEGWKYWSGTGSGEWRYGGWHYLAPPGWQGWTGRSLEEICAMQWVEATRTAWTDLERHRPGRYLLVRHEDALARPTEVYREILEFSELPRSRHLERLLADQERRVFTHRGSLPRAGKWKELHGEEIERVRPIFEDLMSRFYPEVP
jgi:hypothetical protein